MRQLPVFIVTVGLTAISTPVAAQVSGFQIRVNGQGQELVAPRPTLVHEEQLRALQRTAHGWILALRRDAEVIDVYRPTRRFAFSFPSPLNTAEK